MPTDLTPVQRRQQLAEILARGVLRLLRQRPKDSTELGADGLDGTPAARLNVAGGS
jgi:hypothetical protein